MPRLAVGVDRDKTRPSVADQADRRKHLTRRRLLRSINGVANATEKALPAGNCGEDGWRHCR